MNIVHFIKIIQDILEMEKMNIKISNAIKNYSKDINLINCNLIYTKGENFES